MKKNITFVVVFGMLIPVCGCRFCGTDFDPNRPEMRTSVVSKE